MPKLRKRKSEQLPHSGPSVKKSEPGVIRRRSTRGSNRGPDDAVKEMEVFSSIDESSKLPTKSSNANQKDDSTVPEVTVSATGINALSDEVLLQIFSQLSTKTIMKVVSRTCKRWNALSKDKVLWRFVDVRFAGLNPITAKRIFRRYCDPGRLKSLYMRAESPRYGESEIERKQYCQTRCLTPGTMKKLTEVGSQLERFGIEYEQIQWNIDLFSALPSKLTHLSLAHCNLGKDHFNRLLLPGSDSLLKDLLVLDLTGVMVFDLRVLPHLKLPPKLHTLKLRNSELSLYNKGIQQLVLDHHESLVELDLSIMSVCYRFLWDIAEKLKKLEYFNLCGSVIEMDGDDTITHYQGFCIFDDWHEMWGETDGVFESLKTANLRNLTNVAGELMEDPMFIMASYIDVSGKQVLCDDEEEINPTLLSDIRRKWKEWKRSSLETTVHSFEARRKRDIKRRGLHPEWPDNLLPTHPDYNKDAYALARYYGA